MDGMGHYDLEDSAGNLRDFLRTRASLDGNEVVTYWSGEVYAKLPDRTADHLFHFEGYNIARVEEVNGVYQLLTREVSFYYDPYTGELLDTWSNPYNGRREDVVPVWNDPVNMRMAGYDFDVSTTDLGDEVAWHAEVFLRYPSPLTRDEYPDNAQSDMYESAELFNFIVRKDDLANDALDSVPMTFTWTRTGQWLPWMGMGDRPGRLVYHCRGHKLGGGFEGLPQRIKDEVRARAPKFEHAPDTYTTPNETSWTYFKKLKEAQRSDST